MEEEIAPVAGDEQIEPPVVVVVNNAGTVAAEGRRPPRRVHSQVVRDVDEAGPIITEKAVQRAVLVRSEQIEAPIVVHVEPDSAHRLAWIVDPHVPGDIDEAMCGCCSLSSGWTSIELGNRSGAGVS